MTTKNHCQERFRRLVNAVSAEFRLIGPVRQGDQFNFIPLSRRERARFFLSEYTALSQGNWFSRPRSGCFNSAWNPADPEAHILKEVPLG